MPKTTYLASPYTHKNKKVMKSREREITRIAAKLTDRGWILFTPITSSVQIVKFMKDKGTGFASWARIDLTMVGKLDQTLVATMPGWKESEGVTAEIAHAHKLKKPVLYVHPRTLKITRKPK